MKKSFIFLLIILLMTLVPNVVKADSINVTTGQWIYFSTYGISTGCSHTKTNIKNSNKGQVFCAEFTQNFNSGTYTNCTNAKGISEKKQRIAGEIMEFIDGKSGWDGNKKAAYKVAVLNNYLNLSGSSNFSGGSPTVASVQKSAENNYNKYKDNIAKFKKSITISGGGYLHPTSISGTYISGAVTFAGLDKNVEGVTPTYNFSVSGLKSGQVAYLCTSSSGTDCKVVNSNSVSGVTSKTYYVKATGITATTNFSIKISSSITVKNPIGAAYCNGGNQTIILKKNKADSPAKAKRTVSFGVVPTPTPTPTPSITPTPTPKTISHNITVAKVDEEGEAVTGATIEYVDPKPVPLNCSMSGAFYTCSYGPVLESADQFYGKEYCFKETVAPNGFILPSGARATQCYKAPTSADSSELCYHIVDDVAEEKDSDYCNSNIKSICKKIRTRYKEEIVPPEVEGGEPTTEWVVDDSVPVENTYRLKEEVSCNSTDSTEELTTENPYKVTSEELCGIFKGESTEPDVKNNAYCTKTGDYESVRMSNGNLYVTYTNTKTSVTISKKTSSGDDEVPGAELKICTKTDYNNKKDDCTAATTIGGTSLRWTSTNDPMEFEGISKGDYVIVETLPPKGYKLVKTTTDFSMNEYGVVKTGNKVASDNIVVINNDINSLTISKTSMATTKELPGAKMAICTVVRDYEDENNEDEYVSTDDTNSDDSQGNNESFKYTEVVGKVDLDMDGNCVPARLADGTDAVWTSGTSPKKIEGLPAGTYYLVERIAPFGYSTAESILFKMTDDGTLTDKDGKSLANNKLVMKDAPIKDVTTGMLPIIIIGGLGVCSVGGLGYAYFNSSIKHLPRSRKKNY